MRMARIVMAFVVALLAGTPASAAIFTYIVTGTVIGDASVDSAVFGDDVVARGFSARFTVDDAMPLAQYAASVTGSSAQGGGLVQDGTRPPVAATLTINGIDYAIRTGDKDEPPYCDLDFGCFGPSARIDDLGAIVKDAGAGRLDLATRYEDSSSCCADYGSWYSDATDDLRFTLNDAAFTSPDYRQGGTFAVTGVGSFLAAYVAGDRSGGVDAATRLTLAPTALQVSGGVPEPGSWMMMILGFGLIGVAVRRAPRARAV